MSGCAKTVAKTVQVDYFCEGKYSPLWLEKTDFVNLSEMQANPKHSATLNKYLDYHAINEKEYEQCIALVKPQKQD